MGKWTVSVNKALETRTFQCQAVTAANSTIKNKTSTHTSGWQNKTFANTYRHENSEWTATPSLPRTTKKNAVRRLVHSPTPSSDLSTMLSPSGNKTSVWLLSSSRRKRRAVSECKTSIPSDAWTNFLFCISLTSCRTHRPKWRVTASRVEGSGLQEPENFNQPIFTGRQLLSSGTWIKPTLPDGPFKIKYQPSRCERS